ncbi:MAG TPA: helix-turn-helix transcriptional regulator [Actinomycetota bacterium]
MHHLDGIVGSALRQARERTGLSLKDVERLTNGRFKPSTVAGYERGERSITVSRFVALARFYGARPSGLLSDATHAQEGRKRLVMVVPEDAAEVGDLAFAQSSGEG